MSICEEVTVISDRICVKEQKKDRQVHDERREGLKKEKNDKERYVIA